MSTLWAVVLLHLMRALTIAMGAFIAVGAIKRAIGGHPAMLAELLWLGPLGYFVIRYTQLIHKGTR